MLAELAFYPLKQTACSYPLFGFELHHLKLFQKTTLFVVISPVSSSCFTSPSFHTY